MRWTLFRKQAKMLMPQPSGEALENSEWQPGNHPIDRR